MAVPVVMPKLGNTVESTIIVRWMKAKGDLVSQGESLCEVETDKAMVEVESPASGTVLDLFFAEGDEVPVLTNIAAIGEAGEDIESLRPELAACKPTSATLPSRTNGERTTVITGAKGDETTTSSVQVISPRARHLAKQSGLDLNELLGSGPGGRIIERDVRAALAARPRMTPLARSMVKRGDYIAPLHGSGVRGRVTSRDLQSVSSKPHETGPGDAVENIPVRGVRKLIAARMLHSMQTTAQLTLNASADARAMLAYRKRLKTSAQHLDLQKITINHLVLFVVSRTLPDYPELNALFTDDAIARYKHVHLGFAVDTPRGLIVPIIRHANLLNLKQLTDAADRLAQQTLDNSISPDDLQGGTFTVTNLGSLGVESFTPILNPPQVGILGVGSINLKPVDVDGEVQFVPHIGLSLTVNHQVVDGAPAARFLQALSQNFTQIEVLLAL